MRKSLIQFLLVAMLSLFTSAAWAQTTVHGQLVDAETGEPLVGAAVMVEGTTQGSVTDIDGYFKQSVASNATLLFKYIGYKDQKKKITQKGASVELGTIKMQPDAVMLSDVTITSSVAVARKTPVAVSTVDPVFIEEKLGSQEFPEILKSTPGIYTTKDGGGYGDAQTRIRGFKSENVAMMINGVPMNGMENQKVYWSNWAGLSDVTRSMQVQRGLGAAKVSVPAVGGSINIVTKSTEAKRGGFVSYGMGNDGYNKILFSVSSGLSKDGWAFTLLGGKTWGDGYIQGTEFEGYNWFASVAKRFNDNHQLSLTAFGAPQWHNQRNNQNGLTIKEWQRVQKYMGEKSPYRYNPTFGYRNGQAYNFITETGVSGINVIVGKVACKEVPVCRNTQPFHGTDVYTQSSRSLCRPSYVYIIHFDVSLVVGGLRHIGQCTALEVCHQLTGSIVVISAGITVPTPITPREHTVDVQPSQRTDCKVQLNTKVVGIGSGHVQCIAVFNVLSVYLIIKITGIVQSLIHPAGVIGIEVSCEYTTTITVTYFK